MFFLGGTPAVRRALGVWTLGYLLAPESLPTQGQPMLCHFTGLALWASQHCIGSSILSGGGHVTGTGVWSDISSTHSHDKHRCPQTWPGVPRAEPLGEDH